MILAFLQVPGDLPEIDISSEARHPRADTDTTEEKRRNRLYELARKMSEKGDPCKDWRVVREEERPPVYALVGHLLRQHASQFSL